MSYIFSRSPYIIEINESGQSTTKVELFLWNGTGSAPADPTHTLSKKVPSASNIQTTYDISPYIRKYISFPTNQNVYNVLTTTLDAQWCNVKVKRYKDTTLLDTTTYKAFDGFGKYEDGYNPNLGNVFLDEGTYYYEYDSTATLATDTLKRAGFFTFVDCNGYDIKYTDLVSGASVTFNPADGKVRNIWKVYQPTYMPNGNKVEFIDSFAVVQKTYYFKPITECKHTPQVVDFINNYGAWQRQVFFKSSKEKLDIKSKQYNLLQSDLVNYSTSEGQRKDFNINARKPITINSGWVDESFFDVIAQIMLSERVMLNELPYNVVTKSIDNVRHLHKNLINYSLELIPAFDYINNVK